jgi:YihY family inner membrane protein
VTLVARLRGSADSFQRRHPAVAFPVAVLRTHKDASGGELAATLTYYGFLSLFPMLLAGVTILELVLTAHPDLQDKLLGTAMSQFPVGTQLRENVHQAPGGGSAVLGVLVALFGARGVGNALQLACNRIWAVPVRVQPEGFRAMARSFGLLAVVGVGVLATAAATGLAQTLGPLSGVGVTVASVGVDGLLVLAALRIATASVVPTRDLYLGAAVAAVGMVLLHLGGSYLVLHQLKRTGDVYGSFAVVLGLLGWLYLQSQVLLLAVTSSVVRARALWPRSLQEERVEDPDRRALGSFAEAEERVEAQDVQVSWRQDSRR